MVVRLLLAPPLRRMRAFVQLLRVPADLASLASALTARLAMAERSQVGKLDMMYNAVADAVNHRAGDLQEASLRRDIAAYFDAPADTSTECVRKPSPVRVFGSQFTFLVKSETTPSMQVILTPQYLASDIRALLRQARDTLPTSLCVARVLHGLQSAHVSADVWRKNGMWGKHAAVDFQVVRAAAERELAAAGPS